MIRPKGVYHRFMPGAAPFWETIFIDGLGKFYEFGKDGGFPESTLDADTFVLVGPVMLPRVPLKIPGKR
jgi:hypothetical protein